MAHRSHFCDRMKTEYGTQIKSILWRIYHHLLYKGVKLCNLINRNRVYVAFGMPILILSSTNVRWGLRLARSLLQVLGSKLWPWHLQKRRYLDSVLQFQRQQIIIKGDEVQWKLSSLYVCCNALCFEDTLTDTWRPGLKVGVDIQLPPSPVTQAKLYCCF